MVLLKLTTLSTSSAETPRIPPVEIQDTDEVTQGLLLGTVRRYGRPLNAFLTFANHPFLYQRWMAFASYSERSNLAPRVRELVILRTAYRTKCLYELQQHVTIGLECGLTSQEIDHLSKDDDDWDWQQAELAVLRAVDELCGEFDICDETWNQLTEQWSLEPVMDIVFTTGLYMQTAIALRAFRVALDR